MNQVLPSSLSEWNWQSRFDSLYVEFLLVISNENRPLKWCIHNHPLYLPQNDIGVKRCDNREFLVLTLQHFSPMQVINHIAMTFLRLDVTKQFTAPYCNCLVRCGLQNGIIENFRPYFSWSCWLKCANYCCYCDDWKQAEFGLELVWLEIKVSDFELHTKQKSGNATKVNFQLVQAFSKYRENFQLILNR